MLLHFRVFTVIYSISSLNLLSFYCISMFTIIAKFNPWIPKVGIRGDSTKVGSKLTPQYLNETITKLNKIFIVDLDWIDITFKKFNFIIVTCTVVYFQIVH